ncbi:hypothetical protein [Jiangella asiatica]|uniref:CU044_5270 family protein n=1 Tax=Jiangella asiatica TaxID=2530372 RepID=A0A4R5DDT6_9ACTN|nr:hypothetical protein [Jiangella asiatica]TDE08735.1 hypothetical protein E1269_16305 [Jiangella asiatica]
MSPISSNLAFDVPPRRELPPQRREAIRRLLEETVARGVVPPRPRRTRQLVWPAAGIAAASAVAAAVLVVADPGTPGSDVVHAATPPVLAAELSVGQPAGPQLRELAAAASGTESDDVEPGGAEPGGAPADTTVRTESWLLAVTVDGGTEDAAGPAEGAAPDVGEAAGVPAEGAATLGYGAETGTEVVTSAVVPVISERTFREDGSIHLREEHGQPRFPNEEWDESDVPAGAGEVLVDQTFPVGELPSAYPAQLSADPVVLRDQLLTVWPEADDPAAALFQAVREVYGERALGPAVQAATLAMLASEPGVVALGEMTDRSGRDAVAFGTDSDDSGLDRRHVLLVDPESGRMLGYEEVLTGDVGALDVEAPAVAAYDTFH